eukprot:391535_1
MISTILVGMILIHCVISDCKFQSKWTKKGRTLDLSTFQAMGLNISGSDGIDYWYRFSPVNNLFANSIMLLQYSLSTNYTTSFMYSLNISGVEPSISLTKHPHKNTSWIFEYTPNITIQYICDPTASTTYPYMRFTNISQVAKKKHLFQISSAYFCSDNIAPISLNRNQCIWSDPTNTSLVLNLTNLYGEEIVSGGYVYTICADSVYIVEGDGWGYVRSTCCMVGNQVDYWGYWQAVSHWDASINPIYDVDDGSWLFKYYNLVTGGSFKVKWICDPQIDPYEVSGGGTWAIKITSKFVCQDYLANH